jgi:tetratricopeptide (TPR) repeat protein/O-antigen ligase
MPLIGPLKEAAKTMVDSAQATNTSDILRKAILVGLGVMLVLVPLYFSPEMSDYHTPKFILVQVFATILGCLLLLSMVLGGEVYILDHPIYYTILAFIAVNFISLFQAHNIYQGLYSLWIQVCLFLVAILCFHCIQSRQQVHALAGCMIFAAGVVALVGLLQHNDVYHFYQRWNISASTIGNVNFVAEYYNVVYPIALVMLLVVKRAWLWTLLLLVCFMMTCHLIVMGSRGGWLGVVIAATVIGGAGLVRRYHIRRRALDTVLIVGLCILLSWPVLTSVASSLPVTKEKTLSQLSSTYWDLVAKRSTDALILGDTSTRQRVLLWEDTFRLIAERPFLGVGTGNYEFNIQKHLGPESLEIKSRMEKSSVEHMIFRAHNDYLEVWSESGLLGFSVFLVLLIQIVRTVAGLLIRYVKGEEEPLVIGFGAALLATMAHALFSSNFQNPASGVVFWVVVGFVWIYSVKPEDRSRLGLLNTSLDGFSVGVAAVGIVTVLFTVYYGFQMRTGAILFQKARAEITRSQSKAALATLQSSLRYPSPSPFATYEMLGKLHHRLGDWESAEVALERSLMYHGNHPGVHYILGRTYAQQGRTEEAVKAMSTAVVLEPLRSEYRVALGTTLNAAGRSSEAIESIEQALRIDPNSKTAYYALGGVESNRGNYEAAYAAFEEALSLDPSDLEIRNSRAKEMIFLKRFDEAIAELRRIIDQDPNRIPPRLNLAVALYNDGLPKEAVEVCGQILSRWPGYRSARDLMVVILNDLGETEVARRVRAGELP